MKKRKEKKKQKQYNLRKPKADSVQAIAVRMPGKNLMRALLFSEDTSGEGKKETEELISNS